ncbi:MAG: hypothetical protein GXZ15_02940 [Campylobacter sp.]|nr:hypothetical protein [Campylobacter sp.]
MNSKRSKFYIFSLFSLLVLVFEIVYFDTKEYNIESKDKIVKFTSMTNFAFNTQTPHQRHPYAHGINQAYSTHPAFRQRDRADL